MHNFGASFHAVLMNALWFSDIGSPSRNSVVALATVNVTVTKIMGFYFEYIHYDDPFQFLETLSFINVASLANESLKNCLAPHIF